VVPLSITFIEVLRGYRIMKAREPGGGLQIFDRIYAKGIRKVHSYLFSSRLKADSTSTSSSSDLGSGSGSARDYGYVAEDFGQETSEDLKRSHMFSPIEVNLKNIDNFKKVIVKDTIDVHVDPVGPAAIDPRLGINPDLSKRFSFSKHLPIPGGLQQLYLPLGRAKVDLEMLTAYNAVETNTNNYEILLETFVAQPKRAIHMEFMEIFPSAETMAARKAAQQRRHLARKQSTRNKYDLKDEDLGVGGGASNCDFEMHFNAHTAVGLQLRVEKCVNEIARIEDRRHKKALEHTVNAIKLLQLGDLDNTPSSSSKSSTEPAVEDSAKKAKKAKKQKPSNPEDEKWAIPDAGDWEMPEEIANVLSQVQQKMRLKPRIMVDNGSLEHSYSPYSPYSHYSPYSLIQLHGVLPLQIQSASHSVRVDRHHKNVDDRYAGECCTVQGSTAQY
jgi:hypothetical protein